MLNPNQRILFLKNLKKIENFQRKNSKLKTEN